MSGQQFSHEEIKNDVKQRYAGAIQSPGSCCAPTSASKAQKSSCCGATPVEPQGGFAKIAGCEAADLAALPADAVEHSFGCGNPLAFSAVQSGGVVLDIGSGAGIDCPIAAEKVGPRGKVIGLDMTPR